MINTNLKYIALAVLSVISLCTIMPVKAKSNTEQAKEVDICIYGGTSAGVIAAYTAVKQGKTVLLIEPTKRIGGLTSGGLGMTDIGKVDIIQGLAKDFYTRVGKEYGKTGAQFRFEPKVALKIFNDYINESGTDVLYDYRLVSVKKKKNAIKSITIERSSAPSEESNVTIKAKVFIDCSYEGDLMARSGVSYTTGRESITQYGECYNGVQQLNGHQFPDEIDPYKEKGNPESGLLWGILPGKIGDFGAADKSIQAYNYRITLTCDPNNRVDIEKPDNYDPDMFELMLRINEVTPWKTLDDIFIWSIMPNNKTDINNRNGFSTDMIGMNWDYPDGDYRTRDEIAKKHTDYTKGMLYFIGHDKRVPKKIRNEMLKWGYPKDEYIDNNHFTPQLYIRESRRMKGRMTMTQNHCQGKETAEDVVGWGAYQMDSHNCGRYVVNGMVKNEGNVEIKVKSPYNISYRAITPKENEVSNLIVPVCLSASHIAYGSIRMEPVFMVLGESSAIAASLAIDRYDNCVQRVDSKDVMNIFYTVR